MTDVINLNQKRKARVRVEKEKAAAGNRVKFGRTKAQKQKEALQAEQRAKHLDGHKRDPED